jgi:hypothetical protein
MHSATETRHTRARGSDPPSSAKVPDINAETYPFEVVQRLLDQAAYFNLYSVPDMSRGDAVITAAGHGSRVTGFHVREMLCRFRVELDRPRVGRPVSAANWLGEAIGVFEHRWMLIPDDFHARPDRIPPSTTFDSSRPQRFVMLDARCRFGSDDGFRGFGTGIIHPVTHGGRRELVAIAVGTVVEGFGRFHGHEGTYTYCGAISPDSGFRGNLMLRVMDARGDLRRGTGLRGRDTAESVLETGETYVVFRGEKGGRGDRTEYRHGPNGRIIGLSVAQRLRILDIDVGLDPAVTSQTEFGPVIGRMTAEITFDLLNPGGPGTSEAPAPFQSFNHYTFTDEAGEPLGELMADGNEGRTFMMEFDDAPGQRALRFGGFGPIVEGSGPLASITGVMTDNSVVGLAPHALATSYVLRLDDPDRRFRANGG